MRRRGWIATLAMLAAIPATAQTSFPDLRGTWKGESGSIITDGGNAHHPGRPQSEPRLTSVPFTLTIDKQDGRLFFRQLFVAAIQRTGDRRNAARRQPVVCRHRRLCLRYLARTGPAGGLLSPNRHLRSGGVLHGNDQAALMQGAPSQACSARLRRSRSLLSAGQISSIL
jgi:hypothetical protein